MNTITSHLIAIFILILVFSVKSYFWGFKFCTVHYFEGELDLDLFEIKSTCCFMLTSNFGDLNQKTNAHSVKYFNFCTHSGTGSHSLHVQRACHHKGEHFIHRVSEIELDLDLAQILEAYDSSCWNRRKTKRLDQSVVSAHRRHLFPRSPLQSNIIYICWGASP